IALLAGAGVVAAHVDAAASAGAESTDRVEQGEADVQKLSAEGRVRFESMWQNVLRKHGDRLNDEQRTRMRKIIVSNVTMLEAVYAVPLSNGDAPATILLLKEPAPARRRPGTTPATRKPAGPGH